MDTDTLRRFLVSTDALAGALALAIFLALVTLGRRDLGGQNGAKARGAPPSPPLAEVAAMPVDALMRRLGASDKGLDAAEAARRRDVYGLNRTSRDETRGILQELAGRARNPLNILLLTLAAISWTLGDARAAVVIATMVVLSVGLALMQEHRSNAAAATLQAMVQTRASVRRPDAPGDGFSEEPIEDLVPGDVVRLSAGDMIPADLRLIDAKDLFVNQSSLTGEALPVEKGVHVREIPDDEFEIANLVLMGSEVVSGYATALVLRTGADTSFGEISRVLTRVEPQTAFEKGVANFTWLMIRFMAVMAPAVFLINGYTKGDWFEAFLFSVSVAVGLTPEMLPMIVTVVLAKGAIAISRKKVIVKRLDAIQNFGAMDVLCTDKTGTLTQNRIILKRHLDIYGEDSPRVLEYAYLNSHFQSGLKNLLDVAVLEHVDLEHALAPGERFRKIDEIPFDFERRRLSVVVERQDGAHLLICKGAVEEIFAISSSFEAVEQRGRLDPSHLAAAMKETAELNADGFRVVAVAYKETPAAQSVYTIADECDLTLLGYIAFLDPPKDSAATAIAALAQAGVAVKILTGDNDVVTRKVCRDVGLRVNKIVLGAEVAAMNDATLADVVRETTVFAKLSPTQKSRVIDALRRAGHVVGYLGDGINDGPALKCADVGISVDTGVDIARDSADIILLEKSLTVLGDGVVEGRKVFANIIKYIRMGASSNFGNMLSVVGASVFLPFLPMTPIQVLTNNLLYDFSQTAIPTDNVDPEYLQAPRRWDIANVAKFMFMLGPVSSLFDYATFALMIFAFDGWNNARLFQTGWFVESLLTQTLVIHIIRTARVPFFQSRASVALTLATLIVCAIGVALPYSPLADALGLTPLPLLYWPAVACFLLAYAALAHGAKRLFLRRFGM